jgi:hypothetical protein
LGLISLEAAGLLLVIHSARESVPHSVTLFSLFGLLKRLLGALRYGDEIDG